ncbi:hypothetical protein ACFWYW_31050 [Nonomuraea sp. NPDC059023]|uniref:hypothetical protein n=1 Tax=unclassified Nonomuraea TaxID=2593643 RepID=UPI003684EF5F
MLFGRRLSIAIGVVAALCISLVAMDWLFWSVTSFMMVNCVGWEADAVWVLWKTLPMLCYVTAAGFVFMGIRARRRAS